MNSFVLLGIGLAVAAVFMWLCFILKKEKKWYGAVYAGLVTAACIGAVVLGVMKKAPEEATPVTPLVQEEWLCFAYGFAEAGAYEEAMDLLEEYSISYGYDDECSLLSARVYALTGNYNAAEGIYGRLAQNAEFAKRIEAERKLLEKDNVAVDATTLAMVRFLAENGKNPEEFGYPADLLTKAETSAAITPEEIREAVHAAMAEDFDVEEYKEEIERVIKAQEYFETYAASGIDSLDETTKGALEEAQNRLERLKKKGDGLALVGCVRDALLKMNLLLGEYDAIAENLDKYSTYAELVIASELYMAEVVADKDFSKEYTANYGKEAEVVGDKIKEVFAKNKKNLEDEEKEELEFLIKYWKVGLEYPALMQMRRDLLTDISEGKDATDISKAYLAVAKIDHFFENEKSRTENITGAVNFGHDSEDEAYSAAMKNIYSVIHSSESTQEILKVPEYVEDALDHSMPMDVFDLLTPKNDIELQAIEEETGEEKRDLNEEFSQAFTDYVSEVKSSVSIGYIDVSEFETVKARISVSDDYATTEEELKRILSVYDCGMEISDFTVEKVTYDSVKTYLVCDVSGSMAGSIADLRDAVTRYINGKGKSEELAISSFHSRISGTMPFGTADEELLTFAQGLYANGGTAIYNTLIEVLNSFESTLNSNNVIILMTDGEDNYRASNTTIETEMAALAEEKNVTVYTLGLGQVDTGYLSTIAANGRGDFVYVSDSASLDNFYQLLHSQVDNQYIITYKAVDTLTGVGRTLEVKLGDGAISDYKTYSIVDDVEDGYGEEGGLKPAGLFLHGLGTRCIYRNGKSQMNTVIGSGFAKDDVASIKLIGEMEYTANLCYRDESQFIFYLPADVAIGTYDAEIFVNGKKAVLKNALSVLDEDMETTVTYGPYVFTAGQCIEENGAVRLRGNVVLNGWLNFKGDVTLRGDLENDSEIRMKDHAGSYVVFDKSAAVGLGKFLAEKDVAFDMPCLGEFTLYYDSNHMYDFEEYEVDSIRTPLLQIRQILTFDSPYMKLYPDRLEIVYSQAEPTLPFQDVIFKSDGDDGFEIEKNGSAIVNNTNVGVFITLEGDGESKNKKKFTMFNAPVMVGMDELEVVIDTFNHAYVFGAMVNFDFVDFGLGARVAFQGLKPDQFSVTVDKDVSTMVGTVPITFSKFTLGAEDIAPALENKSFKELKIVGSMDIAAAKVSGVFPKLEKYIGDVSVLSMPSTTVELDLSPLSFSTKAELHLFDAIKLLEAGVTIGTFGYSSELLEMDSVTAKGVTASLTAGFNWSIENCEVDISATGRLDATNRFIGVQLENAKTYVDIEWWLFGKTLHKEGDALLGLYFTESGDPQLMLILSSMERGGKRSKVIYYITKDGKLGDAKNMDKLR